MWIVVSQTNKRRVFNVVRLPFTQQNVDNQTVRRCYPAVFVRYYSMLTVETARLKNVLLC